MIEQRICRRIDRSTTLSFAMFTLCTATAQAQNWTAEANQGGSGLGRAVASAGDVNGDGFGDVIVGIRDWDGPVTDSGAARVYLGSAGGLSTTAAWSYSPSNIASSFGICVASAGDVNGDGYDDVLVGAPLYDNGQTNEGRAYLFLGSASGLASTPSWITESNQANAEYGTSVAGIGDVNGDGFADVAVGAPLFDNGQTDEGRVFFFHGGPTGLPIASNTSREVNVAGALFGAAISGGVDFNRDGRADMVVGSQFWDNGQVDEGTAWAYLGTATGVAASPVWQIESNLANSGLGSAVAALRDFNGDGYGDVLIGSQRYDGPEVDEGRAQVYLGNSLGLASLPFFSIESNQAGAFLGSAVASAGYVNDDVFSDIIVGARYYDSGQINEGAAFVYLGAATAPPSVPFATYQSNQVDAELGIAVGGDLDVQRDGAGDVLVGLWQYDNGQVNEGLAWAFYGTPSAAKTRYVSASAASPGLGTLASPYSRIQFALAHPTTKSGDTLSVAPGTYPERLDFLGKNVRVFASGATGTAIVDAGGLGSAARFTRGEGPTAILEGIRLTNGTGSAALGTIAGGGVFCSQSSPTLQAVRIDFCTATLGGGIAILGGAPKLNNCIVRDNFGTTDFTNGIDSIGGGAYLLGPGGIVQWSGGQIAANTCDLDGAGIYTDGVQLELNQVQVIDNFNTGAVNNFIASTGGGICAVGTVTVRITNSTISRNRILSPVTFPAGGGVAAIGPVTLTGCIIESNDAGDSTTPGIGGGLYGSFNATGCSLIGNYGEWEGGGAFGGILTSCTIRANCSSVGGGVYASSVNQSQVLQNYGCGSASADFGAGAASSTLTNSTVEGNSLFGHGAGTYQSNLTGCIVRNNRAGPPGGGGGESGTGGGLEGGTATDCVIEGNVAESDLGAIPGIVVAAGGGAYSATLLRCTLRNNTVLGLGNGTAEGGGAANCTLVKCILHDNSAELGGGAHSCDLDRCTVYANTASIVGGGVHTSSASSSILRANATGQFTASTITYSNVQGGAAGVGNISADPLFYNVTLRDFHLLAGSPCINTGNPAAPLDPNGTRADMGAYPFDPNYCPTPVVYCTAKTNSQGCVPQIGWTGTPTLSGADDFFVRATNVINLKSGLLFWGRAAASQPFQGGTKCVASPSVRTSLSNSGGNAGPDDCSGTYSFHVSHAYMTASAMFAGNTIYAQWWTRDPASLPSLTGLTAGLRFTICP